MLRRVLKIDLYRIFEVAHNSKVMNTISLVWKDKNLTEFMKNHKLVDSVVEGDELDSSGTHPQLVTSSKNSILSALPRRNFYQRS